MLDSQQVFHFISSKLFKETLPKIHLLENLLTYSSQYKNDILKILRVCLDKFQKGFDKQKGSIFGFGET